MSSLTWPWSTLRKAIRLGPDSDPADVHTVAEEAVPFIASHDLDDNEHDHVPTTPTMSSARSDHGPKAGITHTEAVETLSPPPPTHRDRAAQLLDTANHRVIVTASTNRRLLRRIDLAILPIILAVYALQSLDKTALSYGAVFGLIPDLRLRAGEYAWAGAIVYVAQLVWQPVIAYFLVKLPLGKFCGAMVLGWGVTLCGMVAARGFGGLMAARFVLGSFEAAVAPTFVALVQMWYRRSEQTNRNAAWYSMLGVVNIFGSLLSYGLAHIHSDVLRPWQIIFLFCGCFTIAFSTVIFIFLPDSPMQAKFLKGDDKLLAIERVRVNQMGISSRVWRWDHVKECLFLDPKTWLWFAMLTAISIPSGGISTFGPLIIKSFGFDSFTTILFNMPFGAVQLVATLGSAFAATRLRQKAPILAVLCVPPIIGIAILLSFDHTPAHRAVLLFAYYLISVYPAISPLIYSWSSQNTAGDTKRKMTTAVLFIGQSAGNIIGPNLYTGPPAYRRGLLSNLILFGVLMCLVGGGAMWIGVLNRRHAAARARLGKSAQVVDRSMLNSRRVWREDAAATATAEGMAMGEEREEDDASAIGDKGFDDVTDLKNEDFIFVY